MPAQLTPLASSYDKHSIFPRLYDLFLSSKRLNDVPFYVARARRSKGPVLELACGTGRVLIPIARAGIAVVGLDSSPRMLALCREKLSREPARVRSRVRLLRQDMRDFNLPQTFPLAIIPYRSFQFLPRVEDQLACLGRIRRHLWPGGRLVLDLFNPDLQAMVDDKNRGDQGSLEAETEMADGAKAIQRQRIAYLDTFRQLVGLELVFYVKHPGRRERRFVNHLRLRYLFRYEVEHLLARCGFRLERVYADYDGRLLRSAAAQNMICVARKV